MINSIILEDVQKAHSMIMQYAKDKKFQTAIMAAECFRLSVTQSVSITGMHGCLHYPWDQVILYIVSS